MEYKNYLKNKTSSVTVIFLSGFQDFQNVSIYLFLILLVIYCVTVCGNLLIILVVSSSRSLHSPMFFFLTQLSFSDILLSTTIVPNMLHIILYEGSSVSLVGCLAQYYFFSISEILETFILIMMSYDRYQAICHPLHYTSVMDLTFCLKSFLLSWLITLLVILVISITMSYLWFCGPNIIDHFFCDRDPILELSCSDTFIVKAESMFLMVPLAICPFTVIIVFYIYIISAILKIPSTTGRKKTFSTCSSHLAVVALHYGSTISIYFFPNTVNVKKVVSLFYTVVTPFLNPIIYSLNNRDITQAFKNFFTKMSTVFLGLFLSSGMVSGKIGELNNLHQSYIRMRKLDDKGTRQKKNQSFQNVLMEKDVMNTMY
ncbi:olfactory receptor 11L1-like [Anomaloglossus baeobatrachus]|uniref:olfactory receptor 11L1-like n=1 Tax=Anomaloglossus baeobatrachus TaxID=238106 RepID=UPI003F5024FB